MDDSPTSPKINSPSFTNMMGFEGFEFTEEALSTSGLDFLQFTDPQISGDNFFEGTESPSFFLTVNLQIFF